MNQNQNNKMSNAKTAAKTKVAKKTDKTEPERVNVRILVSGEYHTGTTSFTFAKGAKASLPKATAETHEAKKNLIIL